MISFCASPRVRSSLAFLPFLLLHFTFFGCGGGNPFDMAPVSGKVTYEDGSAIPASSIRVLFYPQCEPVGEKHAKFASAELKVSDGTFAAVSTWKPADGAVLGAHKVVVISYDKKGEKSDVVPAKYNTPKTSTIKQVEVKPGQNHFGDIKVERPSSTEGTKS